MIALPELGVQLQTTRGISIRLPFLFSSNAYHLRIPLSTTSELVPLEQVSTIVIHEGLRRWRVEYYLAIIKRSGSGIVVGFPVSLLAHRSDSVNRDSDDRRMYDHLWPCFERYITA